MATTKILGVKFFVRQLLNTILYYTCEINFCIRIPSIRFTLKEHSNVCAYSSRLLENSFSLYVFDGNCVTDQITQ